VSERNISDRLFDLAAQLESLCQHTIAIQGKGIHTCRKKRDHVGHHESDVFEWWESHHTVDRPWVRP
jgi:hypothetical protein